MKSPSHLFPRVLPWKPSGPNLTWQSVKKGELNRTNSSSSGGGGGSSSSSSSSSSSAVKFTDPSFIACVSLSTGLLT